MISSRYHGYQDDVNFPRRLEINLLINHRENRYYGIINDFILRTYIRCSLHSVSLSLAMMMLYRYLERCRRRVGVRELNFSSLGFYGRERETESSESLNQSRVPIITPFRNFINDSISRRRNVIIGDIARFFRPLRNNGTRRVINRGRIANRNVTRR